MGAITATEQELAGLHVYLAEPVHGDGRGMLLLPSRRGLSPHLRRYADEIAAAGVTALAWDHFHGRDVADLPLEQLMALTGTLSDAAAHAEQTRLLETLVTNLGLRQVGVIGWCMGGRYALLLAARDRRLAACVAYHPTIRRPLPAHQTEDAVALAREIACPVQAIYPGGDQVVPPAIFAELREASEANRVATALAWPQTMAFIQASLAP
jgi:carboxymethylenebutenolidase